MERDGGHDGKGGPGGRGDQTPYLAAAPMLDPRAADSRPTATEYGRAADARIVTLDQAVFTSIQAARGAGYQLAGRSAGVTADESRELSRWGPSHDSLVDPAVPSVNFHRLDSGRLCASRSAAIGGEYSGRGAQVYTQMVLLSAEQLAEFSGHPFYVLQAAVSAGELPVHEEVPSQLPSLSVRAAAPTSDAELLRELGTELPAGALAELLDAVISGQGVGVVAPGGMGRSVASLLACLPVPCRVEVTFCTGLKPSPRRPFRVVPAPDDPMLRRRVERQYNLRIVDLGAPVRGPSRGALTWPDLVSEVAAAGHWEEFAAWLHETRDAFRRAPPTLATLNRLAPRARDALACGTQ